MNTYNVFLYRWDRSEFDWTTVKAKTLAKAREEAEKYAREHSALVRLVYQRGGTGK